MRVKPFSRTSAADMEWKIEAERTKSKRDSETENIGFIFTIILYHTLLEQLLRGSS